MDTSTISIEALEVAVVGHQDIGTERKIALVLEAINDSEKALMAATEIDAMLHIRDRAQAIQFLTRKAKLAMDVQNQAALLAINAERAMGEFISAMPKNAGAMGNPGGRGAAIRDCTALTYSEIGITYREASRMQAIANLPEANLDDFVAEVQEAGRVLTVSSVNRYANNWAKKHTSAKQFIYGPKRENIYKGKLTLSNFLQVAKLLREAITTDQETQITIDILTEQ